jgi:hypothetical protein
VDLVDLEVLEGQKRLKEYLLYLVDLEDPVDQKR